MQSHARSFDVRSFQWHRSRFPRLTWNQTLRLIPRSPSLSWYNQRPLIEVTRHSKLFSGWLDWCAQGTGVDDSDWVGNQALGAGEGVEYGCWLTPSVGTGVFLPTRRMLYLVDRLEAEHHLHEVMRFPLQHHNTTYASRDGQYITIHHRDCLYAKATRERGFDGLFIEFNPEGAPHIIMVSPGCMHQPKPLQTACVPVDVGLRTGWSGEQACACADDELANDAEGIASLANCALS